jgi:hypothetical protein
MNRLPLPAGGDLAGDLPFLPASTEQGVQPRTQRFEPLLGLVPDHVDLGIVGNGLKGYVRRALIDEALADVAVSSRQRLGKPANSS